MAELETPMGLALIICDQIIEDRLSGKKSLVGLCDRIGSTQFPCVHSELGVFVTLTSGRGEYPCEIVCRHSDNKTLAFSAKGQIALQDPSQVVDIVFRLRGLRFPKPGTYWVHFLADGVPIMMRPLRVQQMEKPEASGEQKPS